MKKKTFKNTLAVALLSCAALGASVAHAAESQSYTINLTATVPAHDFQIDPVDSDWITQTQTMEFDTTSKTLKPFKKQFRYQSGAGAIQAKLTGDLRYGNAVLSAGINTIPLTVTFNNSAVTNVAKTVVTAAAAKTGGIATLSIAQESDEALPLSGTYTGSVAMIFEPVVD